MKDNFWIIIGGIFGFTAVALGAFGAHSLRDVLSKEMQEIFKTGALYHLVHSVIITSIGLLGNGKYNLAGWFLSIGIILFSGSLYFFSISTINIFAIITPFGGISFLIGWVLLIISALKKN